MMEIETVYGMAVLQRNAGWVLRYPDPEGEREVPLEGQMEAEAARRAALLWLGQQGVGAGRCLTSDGAAEVAQVQSRAAWRSLAVKWEVSPGGRYDGRTPWWWESHVVAARASRVKRARRTLT